MQNYILAFLLTTAGAQAELSRLDALSLIESGDNDAAVGRAGEVSRFQIMPAVWASYCGSRAFRDSRTSARVAAKHLRELTVWFERCTGRSPTDFDVYVMWNAGATYYHKIGFKTSRVNRVITERAHRYASLRAKTPARRRETSIASTSPQRPIVSPAPKPRTIAVARSASPPKEPLWPVFEQTLPPVRLVPVFALTPGVLPAVPQPPSASAPYTLGVVVLPAVR